MLGWTEEGWEELADPFAYHGLAGTPIVSFDASGAPVIAFSDPVPEHSAYWLSVITWDGAGWSTLLGSEHVSVGSLNLRFLALPDDRLLLSYNDWQDFERISLFDSGEWEQLPPLKRASDAPLQLTHDTNGMPFMVWPTTTGLALYELSESGWQAVAADEERLATLPEHLRSDVFTEQGEIYLRRFEECGWRGLSASNRGGGISNSGATSRDPLVSLRAGTTCVAWVERAESEPAQLVRCHD